MNIILEIHSLLRWVIVIVAALAAIRFTLGWLRGLPFAGMDRGLTAAFSGLMDVQVLLGLTYFLWTGVAAGFYPLYRLEHLGVMILAAIAAHLPSMWKKKDDRTRFRNSLWTVLFTLLLVFLGVALLPGGWSR